MESQNKSLFIENAYEPETTIGHLQLVFALMQCGKQRSIDPGDFITTLRIDTNQQQDAHVRISISIILYNTIIIFLNFRSFRICFCQFWKTSLVHKLILLSEIWLKIIFLEKINMLLRKYCHVL